MSDFISSGWSWYVIAIVVFGLLFCVMVLMGASRHKVIYDAQGKVDKTTGHVWDHDLRELNNPLPRWWLILFILTLVFSAGYLMLYPGLGDRRGSLNWSSKNQFDAEIAKARLEQDRIFAQFKNASVEDLARNPRANAIGQRLFLNSCAACHGSDAKGAKGFPNLTDSDWLHGGSPDRIIETITKGRRGEMPVMAQAVGGPEEIRQVAHYVLSLSGSGHNSIQASLGQGKFKAACAGCHGANGQGNQVIGAPNLSDRIWLHGWGEQAIVNMVNHGKVNVMPAQEGRLSPDQIRLVAAYVWGLSHSVQTASR